MKMPEVVISNYMGDLDETKCSECGKKPRWKIIIQDDIPILGFACDECLPLAKEAFGEGPNCHYIEME
jgi:hypothetical protein